MTYETAVTNQMGGAGKTTTAINTAGALAHRGHDVLLVDMDPQGTATEGAGFEDLYHQDVTSLFEVLTDIERTNEINDLVREHPEFDLIPSNLKMFKADKELTVGVPQSEARLRAAFDALAHDYDAIVIDSPPSLNQLSDNSIIAAGRVLIPMRARRRSIRALEILGEQITLLETTYDQTVNGGVERLGIIVNETDHPLDGDEAYMVNTWAAQFSLPDWEIRKRVAIARAWNNGRSIFGHDEACDQEATYLDLAQYLEEQGGLTAAREASADVTE